MDGNGVERFETVVKTYRTSLFGKRGVPALRGVSLHVEPGETVGIVGEYGGPGEDQRALATQFIVDVVPGQQARDQPLRLLQVPHSEALFVTKHHRHTHHCRGAVRRREDAPPLGRRRRGGRIGCAAQYGAREHAMLAAGFHPRCRDDPDLPGHVDLILQITSALRTRSSRSQGDDQAIRGLLQLLGDVND